MRATAFQRRVLIAAGGLAIVLGLLILGYFLGASSVAQRLGVDVYGSSISECTKEHFALTKPMEISSQLIAETSALCYSQIHGQGLLNDFYIRRLKFVQQSYDERILLWLVVALTFAGVGLAGIQLMASYQLAAKGRGEFDGAQELAIESNRISLKSSVTGLFILVFSFLFFTVFVYEIYKIKPVDADAGTPLAQVREPLESQLGTLKRPNGDNKGEKPKRP